MRNARCRGGTGSPPRARGIVTGEPSALKDARWVRREAARKRPAPTPGTGPRRAAHPVTADPSGLGNLVTQQRKSGSVVPTQRGPGRLPSWVAMELESPSLRLWLRAYGLVVFLAKPPPSLITAKHVSRRRESSLSSRVRPPGTSSASGCPTSTDRA
jgi:hypothetical protein